MSTENLTEEEQAALDELKAMEAAGEEDTELFDPKNPDMVLTEEQVGQQVAEKMAERDQAALDAEAAAEAAAAAEQAGATEQPGEQPGAEAEDDPEDYQEEVQLPPQPSDEQRARLDGAIDAERLEIERKYDEGELTAAERREQIAKLNAEERELIRMADRFDDAVQAEQQRQTTERNRTVAAFLKEKGIKMDKEDPSYQALDFAVRMIATNPKNENLSVKGVLKRGYELAVKNGAIKAAASEPTPKVPPKPGKPEAVKTLAKLPAAEMPDASDDGGKFAAISRIRNPDVREREFAKLSPAEQEQYLATCGG